MEKKLFTTIIFAMGIIGSLFFTFNHYFVSLSLVLFPMLLILSFRYCFLCIEKLPRVNFKTPIFISGLILIIGASLLDNIVTLTINPDLSRESNIIVISMFNQGMSLYQTIIFDSLFQTLFIILSVLFWMLCYKSLPIIAHDLKGKNLTEKILLTYGIKKFTLKNILFSMDNEVFYINAYIGMLLLCTCIYRIYCVLEWLELVPMSRIIAPTVVIIVSNVVYITYLVNYSNKLRDCSKDSLVDVQ